MRIAEKDKVVIFGHGGEADVACDLSDAQILGFLSRALAVKGRGGEGINPVHRDLQPWRGRGIRYGQLAAILAAGLAVGEDVLDGTDPLLPLAHRITHSNETEGVVIVRSYELPGCITALEETVVSGDILADKLTRTAGILQSVLDAHFTPVEA